MAAPIANGVATKAESKVTTNDPKIIGRAPNLPSDGDQSPLKARQKKVIVLPNISRREFLEGDVNCFTNSSFFMLTPHSSLRRYRQHPW